MQLNSEDINNLKIKYEQDFHKLTEMYHGWVITKPDFASESLLNIQSMYQEILFTLLMYQKDLNSKLQEQLESKTEESESKTQESESKTEESESESKTEELESKTQESEILESGTQKRDNCVKFFVRALKNFFVNGEVVIDYKDVIFRQMHLDSIKMAGADEMRRKILDEEAAKTLTENFEDKEDYGRLFFGAVIYLMLFNHMEFYITNHNNSITIEKENITVYSTKTKIINSDIFNDENGRPYSFTEVSTETFEIMTKIIIKDKDVLFSLLVRFTNESLTF